MKKKYLYNIVALFLATTIAISLTSCDKDSDSDMSGFAGAWKVQSQSGYGMTIENDEENWDYSMFTSNGTILDVQHKNGNYTIQTLEYWVDSKTRTLSVRPKSVQTTETYSTQLTGTTIGYEIVEKTDNKMTLRALGATVTFVRVSNSEFEQKYATVMNAISSLSLY